jgi:catalase
MFVVHDLMMRRVQHRPSSTFNAPYWTTNSGAPVWNNDNSLTVGARGNCCCWCCLSVPTG